MSGRGPALHRRFSRLEGGGYVASGYALDGLARWVARRRPSRVLELGAGIGATTAALVAALDEAGVPLEGGGGPRHVAVERVPFCLDRLAVNLGAERDKVVVVDWATSAPPGPYDLVLVDGLDPDDGDDAVDRARSDAETAAAVADLARRAVLVVENDRVAQRRTIERVVRPGWTHAHVRPWDGTPGYHLYLFDPTPFERAALAARRAADSVWHPRGRRALRTVVRRTTGRGLRTRDDVARGS